MVDEVAGFLLPGGSLLCVIAAVESAVWLRAAGLIGQLNHLLFPRGCSHRACAQKENPNTHVDNTFIIRSLLHSVCTSAPWGVVNNERPGETPKCKYSLSGPHSLAHQSRRLRSKIAYTTHLMWEKKYLYSYKSALHYCAK